MKNLQRVLVIAVDACVKSFSEQRRASFEFSSPLISKSGGKQIRSERRQPVLALVVAACYMRQARLRVRQRRADQIPACRIIRGKCRDYILHAPCAAEIEAVQMHQLWIS